MSIEGIRKEYLFCQKCRNGTDTCTEEVGPGLGAPGTSLYKTLLSTPGIRIVFKPHIVLQTNRPSVSQKTMNSLILPRPNRVKSNIGIRGQGFSKTPTWGPLFFFPKQNIKKKTKQKSKTLLKLFKNLSLDLHLQDFILKRGVE